MNKNIAQYGDLLIRIVAGLIFILAGYGKLFASPGIDGFTGMLSGLGFPAPAFFAVVVGLIELIGGILLLLGLWTHIVATLLAVIMLVAIVTVHLSNGWGAASGVRYPLLLLVVLIRYIGTPGFCDIKGLMGAKKGKK